MKLHDYALNAPLFSLHFLFGDWLYLWVTFEVAFTSIALLKNLVGNFVFGIK